MIEFPDSAFVLFLACLSLAVARYPIPAAIFGVAAFGSATGWVWKTYDGLRTAGAPIPRWLARLELLREYLASEDGPEASDKKHS